MQAHLKALRGKRADNSTHPYAYVILQDLTPFRVYPFAAKNPPIPMHRMGGNLPAYPKSNIAMNASGNGSSIGCGVGDKS